MRKREAKRDYVREMIDKAAQEVNDWKPEKPEDIKKKAEAIKDLSDAAKGWSEGKVDKKFVLDLLCKVLLFVGFAAWEERHVIGKTLGTLMRGRL